MRKILFDDRYGLTESVLQRRKTKTRRSCKDRATNELILASDVASYRYYPEENLVEFLMQDGSVKVSVPPYKIGEVVAVAQPYKAFVKQPRFSTIDIEMTKELAGWNNKMFVCAELMPHQIRILDFNVEQLRDISDEDCMKEGIEFSDIEKNWFFTNVNNTEYHAPTCRAAFASLIDKVSGKDTWEHNPYVFVYSFELVK